MSGQESSRTNVVSHSPALLLFQSIRYDCNHFRPVETVGILFRAVINYISYLHLLTLTMSSNLTELFQYFSNIMSFKNYGQDGILSYNLKQEGTPHCCSHGLSKNPFILPQLPSRQCCLMRGGAINTDPFSS